MTLGQCFEDFVVAQMGATAAKEVMKRTALAGVMATVMLPLTLVGAASIIDNPWTMSTDRADKAGVLLATALLERQHGHRRSLDANEVVG